MKILHITNNYPTKYHPVFGIFVKEQIESLEAQDIQNEVFFINGREEGRRAYLRSIFKLRKQLRSENYDIIHCHHAFSAIILLISLSPHKSIIVSYQNDPYHEGGLLLYKILKFFFNKIILKNDIEDFRSPKVYYLPNGVDIHFFQPIDRDLCIKKLNLDGNLNYILFMDSYNRRTQKRIDRFYEIIQILQKNGNPLKIEPLVLTSTDRELVPYYMNASSVHLLTSDFEGSPNSVKECLACNTKVVSTPVGNINDLIGAVPGCYISSGFSSNELAELVTAALNCFEFEGRTHIINKGLDIHNIALRLINIYRLL